MSGPISIGSTGEWHSLLGSTNVVIVDFYADWCGPCKMIGPHFDRLAKEHSRPKKMAFAKVNVDHQATIAKTYGVSAMPTFKIFHGTECVETLKGADPSSLSSAISKAVKLSDTTPAGKPTEAFSKPGRTLGGAGGGRKAAGGSGFSLPRGFSVFGALNMVVLFIGLYFVTLFSFDALAAAENSWFNKHRKAQDIRANLGSSSTKLGANASESSHAIEQVVRDAKQRFRDTLPKNYLNDEEYALYVRLYGPPLRETDPEDVGIHMHADMGLPETSGKSQPDNEATLLREVEGRYEEVAYHIPPKEAAGEDQSATQAEETNLEPEETRPAALEPQELMEKSPTYVESVARSQRELDALQKLVQQFEETRKEQREADAQTLLDEVEVENLERVEEVSWPAKEETAAEEEEYGYGSARQRYHPLTEAGRFHGNPIELLLPQEELVQPITDLLKRTHVDHVREAAESVYGGPGLPLSPEMVLKRRSGHMGGVGLLADQHHMTEIEADAFLAGFMPAAFASILATVREVRKRLGSDWIQSKLKNKGEGLSVLDAGAGGAGLLAWEQVLNAEWDLLIDKGEVRGHQPPGRKTVIATSERLRNRLKTFLHDTTFLPRMPDYEHSGEMRGPRLDGGSQQQPRKSYDVIISSHLFLREKESHRRQAILNNLWHLLKKDGGVLIIIEKAHPRGFEAVAHARDTILNQFLLTPSGESRIAPEDFNPTWHREPEPGHVIAPCTNQGTCPMYPEPGKSVGRKDFCHFSQRFVRPSFYNQMLRKKVDNRGEAEFSYVAVQRGVARHGALSGKEATELAKTGYEKSEEQPDMQSLPRLILPAIKRKGHVSMDVCTPEGTIERWTVPKSFSKLAYRDARKSRWGDLWALGAKSHTRKEVKAGVPDDGGKRASAEGRQPRAVRVDMDEDGTTETVPHDRKSKGRKRQQDLLAELKRIHAEGDRLLGEEIDAEVIGEDPELERHR
ncbi:unnamed protein product [Clonostachys solani]|uniref:Thioredoxin domain-containing protein n=1 Tax=Clonostachys solani TaxID=160281 RepID=A0A9N9YTH1_9HYPO|nr:unnamed protein product [Clonostachys solani]